jgi:hypothetical protein
MGRHVFGGVMRTSMAWVAAVLLVACGSKDPETSGAAGSGGGAGSAHESGGQAGSAEHATGGNGSGGSAGANDQQSHGGSGGMASAAGNGGDVAGSGSNVAGSGGDVAGSGSNVAGSGGDAAGSAGDAAGAGGAAGSSASQCDGRFLPMAVGNSWTYRVTNPVDGVSMKITEVDKMSKVGGAGPNAGKTAFHVVTSKQSGAMMDMSESWQDVLADGSVVRYRELSFSTGTTQANGEDSWDPYKMHFDQSPEHVASGASWDERYTETKIDKNMVTTSATRTDSWTVDAVDVPCGPVKGEMLSCIKLSKTAGGGGGSKTYLFAPCVGKVREEGTQTEELTDYSVQ